jgi:oxygen-dependent protoporphyrinogen oxidase
MTVLKHLINDDPTRVVIIGGGVGGLVAAWELARPGFEVVLLKASDRLGGSVQRLDLALADGSEVTVDAGAESFATRGGHVAAYLEELHLGDQVVQPNPAGAWLQLPGKAVPMPKGGMLGTPRCPSRVTSSPRSAGAVRCAPTSITSTARKPIPL